MNAQKQQEHRLHVHMLGHDQLHPEDFEDELREHAVEHGWDAVEPFDGLLERHVWHHWREAYTS